MSTGLGPVVAAFALMVSASDASAQVVGDCRCVDADGNAIDNCTCFVTPDFQMPDVPEIMAFEPNGDFGMAFRSARPRLGVTVRADQDDGYDAQGARVQDVMEGGPADEAGIREGDVITSVGGRSLFEPLADDAEADLDLDESIPVQRLLAIARELEPGESVAVGYLRDGQAMTTTVEVRDLAGMWGAWADDFAAEFRPHMERFQREVRPRMERFREELRPQIEELRERVREQSFELDAEALQDIDGLERLVIARSGSTARFGVSLVELTPGLGEYFGVEEGVLVTDVAEDSTLGLVPGDVILRIGDRQVTRPSRVARILRTYDDGDSIPFRVLRQRSEIDVMGRLGG